MDARFFCVPLFIVSKTGKNFQFAGVVFLFK